MYMDPFRAIVSSLVIVIALLLLVPIVDDFAAARDVGTSEVRVEYDQAYLEGAGTLVDVGDGDRVGDNETVYQTTGYALRLDGSSDAEVTGDGVADLGNDTTWTVSVWASPDAGSGRTMELASVSDGEVRIYLNESRGEWAVWYYRQSTRDSYEVTAATSSPVGNLTNLQARANGTHLQFYRNDTLAGATDITVASTEAAPTEATNWDGRVEELRVFGDAVSATVQTELYADPAEQRPGQNRIARLMFDQASETDTTLEAISALELSVSGGQFVKTGFAENITDPETFNNNLAGESDYDFDTDGPRLEPLADGELDGAPIAYVDYNAAATGTALSSLTGWLGVAALVPLVLISVAIISRVAG